MHISNILHKNCFTEKDIANFHYCNECHEDFEPYQLVHFEDITDTSKYPESNFMCQDCFNKMYNKLRKSLDAKEKKLGK